MEPYEEVIALEKAVAKKVLQQYRDLVKTNKVITLDKVIRSAANENHLDFNHIENEVFEIIKNQYRSVS